MLTMFVRAFVLYVLVILLMRLMGKRQIGQLQPFELVFSVIVADLAASPMSDVGIPLLYGVMPIAALMLCYALFSLVTLKSERARELLSGKPAVLVQQGVVDEDEMRRQGMTLTELMEQMRADGVEDLLMMGAGPWKTASCMSAYCVNAQMMADTVHMKCWENDGKIRYFSLILFGQA